MAGEIKLPGSGPAFSVQAVHAASAGHNVHLLSDNRRSGNHGAAEIHLPAQAAAVPLQAVTIPVARTEVYRFGGHNRLAKDRITGPVAPALMAVFAVHTQDRPRG